MKEEGIAHSTKSSIKSKVMKKLCSKMMIPMARGSCFYCSLCLVFAWSFRLLIFILFSSFRLSFFCCCKIALLFPPSAFVKDYFCGFYVRFFFLLSSTLLLCSFHVLVKNNFSFTRCSVQLDGHYYKFLWQIFTDRCPLIHTQH